MLREGVTGCKSTSCAMLSYRLWEGNTQQSAAPSTGIKKVETVEYPELGMEATCRIKVVDFPAFIVVDDKGNDFLKELNLG